MASTQGLRRSETGEINAGEAMSDAPIKPVEYGYGLNVIDIGDLRIARGETRRPRSACTHRNMVHDSRERRIWCADCESEVEPFDAFKYLCEAWNGAVENLNRRKKELSEAELFAVRSRAAKLMDQHWRSKTRAPCCPHCKVGILPEDVTNGLSTQSKEWILASRKSKSTKNKDGN